MAPLEAEQPQHDSKESLEVQKLQLEIAGLRRWWLHGPFLSIIASLLIASATIGIGFLNGWFDVQRQRIEVQRDRLALEVAALEKQRRELETKRSVLERESREISNNIDGWREQIEQVRGRLQNVGNTMLTGAFRDQPVLQYSQINQLRIELQKIADSMVVPDFKK